MADMIASELAQAWNEFVRAFAHFLPRLLAILIIALLGWLIASALKIALRSLLRLIKFDRLSERAGASRIPEDRSRSTPEAELLGLADKY